MEPLTRRTLRGTWGTVLLPIGDDDAIEYPRLRDELSVLVSSGVAGCYTGGTAGELHTLEEHEHDAVSELVAETCAAAGMPFQIGASHMSGQICLSRVRRARELSPSAIQVCLPDWLALSAAEALAALTRLAEVAAPVPIVLYNPPHAKTRCGASELAGFAAAVPSLAGVKVAPPDAAFYGALGSSGSGLALFVPGHELATGLGLGAAGSYSNVACLSPSGAVRFEAIARSSISDGLELEARIQRFFAENVAPLQAQGYANPALDKTLAAIGGWAPIGTRVRWPWRSVPEELATSLAGRARGALPELFAGSVDC